VAVPISDSYIIQYLLDGTVAVPVEIHWREKDPEHVGYMAQLEGVDVILEPVYSRAGSRQVLRFCHDGEEFVIHEPACGGWLGRKFSTDDERDLVRLLRGLSDAVVSQCTNCRQRDEQNQEEIREDQPPAAFWRISGNLKQSCYRRTTVTDALADLVGSATLTALTVTTNCSGTIGGAT